MKLLKKVVTFLGVPYASNSNGQAEAIENHFRSWMEGLEDGYFEIQPDGYFIYFNNFFARLTGYRPKDLRQKNVFDLCTIDSRPHIESVIRKIHRTGLSTNLLEWTIVRRDGERRTFEASVSVKHSPSGEQERILYGIVRDITDRKETEEALNLSHRAMSAAHNGIIITDPRHLNSIVYCNPALEKMTGYDRDDILGKSYTVFFGPGTDLQAADAIRTSLENMREHRGVIRCYRKDATPFWSEILFSPVRDREGRLTHYIGIMCDLTNQVQNQYRLRESEERFRKLLENASDVVSVVAEDGTILYESPAVERILGYESARSRVGQNLFDFVHPDDHDRGREAFIQIVESNEKKHTFTFRMATADGSWRMMESIFHNLLDHPIVQGIIINSRDITDRIATEQRLRESEEQCRLFFDEDLTGDYIATTNGEILSCNESFAKMFGFGSVEHVLHTNIVSLFPSPKTYSDIIDQVQQKKIIKGHELEMKRVDGKTVYVIENVVGHFNDRGEVIEIKGYMFDNTERKRLEQQLLQAHRMQSLGTLAAGVAHDFNNVLSIVDGSLNLLKTYIKDEALLKYIEMSERAVERGADLVGSLLTFARTEDVHIHPFVLRNVVDELTKVLRHTFDKKITVKTCIEPGLPLIKGERGQVYQMLLNLCINSRDAILERKENYGQEGIIHISAVRIDGEKVREKYSEANESHYVQITVHDNGIGMSDAVRCRIFDPFFTTKPKGQGTGLGLSVVYGAVKSHAGYIEVESEEGVGTRVDIYLPALFSDEQSTVQVEDLPVKRGTETILIVEDEEMMLSIVSDVLRAHGYEILQARDGLKGLEIFRAHHKRIGAVILDVGLPKISGWELYKQMKEIDESVRIIIATGFHDPAIKEDFCISGIREYIQKPYKPKDILSALRRIFDHTD